MSAEEKAPNTVPGAESHEIGPAETAHPQYSALDRLVNAFDKRMTEMGRELEELRRENKRLKDKLADAYDWSLEVAR